MTNETQSAQQARSRVAALSIGSNCALVVIKLVIGLVIGSVSVVSEAIHSGVDLIASVIAWLAVRMSAAPADDRHPYGYGKIENVSGVLEALLIFLGAGWIMFESVSRLIVPEPLDAPLLGIGVMAASSIANFAVSRQLFRVGTQTDSMALIADAWHLRTDVYTSAGVMGGLLLIQLGHIALPGARLDWIDPVAAIAVAVLIVRAAWDLTQQAGRDLLDARLSAEDETVVHNSIASWKEIRGYHALRTRKAGAHRFIDFHLVMDGHMSVLASHDVAMAVTRDIESKLQGARVVTHVEPCVGRCTERCLAGCLLTEPQREEIRRLQ